MVDVATGAGGKSNEQVFYNLNVPVFISKSLLNFSIIILYVMLIVVFISQCRLKILFYSPIWKCIYLWND